MNRLPKKPSKLIRLAIEDLEKVEKLPHKYEIDMGQWHTPQNYGDHKCSVCLAGSVMAMRFHADPKDEIKPRDFARVFKFIPSSTQNRLIALDWFRRGHVKAGLRELGYPGHIIESFTDLDSETPYLYWSEHEPARFKKPLLELADKLEQRGL